VQGTDGRLYGPAEIGTLSQWATEGRILADTVLTESGTNKQVLAKDLPGLKHHFQLHTGSPQQFGIGQARPQTNQPQPSQPSGQPQPGQPQPGQTIHQPYQPGGQPQPGQQGYIPYQNPPSPYPRSQPYQAGQYAGPRKNKVAAAVLAFVLGAFGVHRFYLGYIQTAIIMLVLGVFGYCFCGIGIAISAIWGIYDGIMILTDKMPDANGQPLE